MKKYIQITKLDGTKDVIELGTDPNNILKPADHPEYIGAMINVARSGYCPNPKDKYPEVVPPSQIKSVNIIEQ